MFTSQANDKLFYLVVWEFNGSFVSRMKHRVTHKYTRRAKKRGETQTSGYQGK